MKLFWYPICFSKDVTKQKQHEPLVLFRGKDNKGVCAQDLCSHRSAKLSLGNMIDGVLECQYHGWQYGYEGKCEKSKKFLKKSS
jgi:phenylpropionate dioxygenase-like ring-hydroxylating dioxygenase large terminal subunit